MHHAPPDSPKVQDGGIVCEICESTLWEFSVGDDDDNDEKEDDFDDLGKDDADVDVGVVTAPAAAAAAAAPAAAAAATAVLVFEFAVNEEGGGFGPFDSAAVAGVDVDVEGVVTTEVNSSRAINPTSVARIPPLVTQKVSKTSVSCVDDAAEVAAERASSFSSLVISTIVVNIAASA